MIVICIYIVSPLCEIVWDDVMEDTFKSYTKAKVQMPEFNILTIVFI